MERKEAGRREGRSKKNTGTERIENYEGLQLGEEAIFLTTPYLSPNSVRSLRAVGERGDEGVFPE